MENKVNMKKGQQHKTSYIGITGFMTREEVETMLSLMPLTSERLLMVGILANWKTMQGFKSEGGRHPNIENIKKIFVSHPAALNLIHYSTKKIDSLCEQLAQLAKLSDNNLHGFQLNIVWPPKDELSRYRSIYPHHKIIMTIGDRAIRDVGNSPYLLTSKISEYEGLIDYILLDRSLGYGIPIDPKFMRKYVTILHVADLTMGIAIAGGLSPTTLGVIEPLIKDFPDLSIDAENNLRNQDDSLNLGLAQDYLDRSLQIFGEI